MQEFFEQIRNGLAIIGLVTTLWLVYRLWCAIKATSTSARKSNDAFRKQTLIEVEDHGELGAEAAWPQK